MQYKTLMQLVKESVSLEGGRLVTIPQDLFRTLLIAAIRNKAVFDDKFYSAINSDIKEAIRTTQISSAEDHYYNSGYFEGRLPKKFLVDEKYYLEKNPDVSAAIRSGVIKSAQEHFEYAGFREGRAPYKDFSLF
jgi:hypothetical protein